MLPTDNSLAGIAQMYAQQQQQPPQRFIGRGGDKGIEDPYMQPTDGRRADTLGGGLPPAAAQPVQPAVPGARPVNEQGWRDYLGTRGGGPEAVPTYQQWTEGNFNGNDLLLSPVSDYNNFLDKLYAADTAGQNELYRAHGLQQDSPYGGAYGWVANDGIEALPEGAWAPRWTENLDWDTLQDQMRKANSRNAGPQGGGSGGGGFGGPGPGGRY